jgi:hypothetical protein
MTWDTPPAQGAVVTVKPLSEWSDDERRRGISAAYWKVAKPWLAWAFVLPATLRVLGVLVGWVIRGFRWRDIQTLT